MAIDGEMQVYYALDKELRDRNYLFKQIYG